MNVSSHAEQKTSVSNHAAALSFDCTSLRRRASDSSCIHKADGVINPAICAVSDASEGRARDCREESGTSAGHACKYKRQLRSEILMLL